MAVYTFAILLPNNNSSATANITPTPVTTPTAIGKTSKTRKVVGTIQSIGSQMLTILLRNGKKTVTANVDSSTTYTTLTGAGTFNDLKVGQFVQVKGHIDPQDSTTILATSITVTTPKSTPTVTSTP
ncbi:MAG: hypothetical protein NVS4B7_12690 [Ktedonobacteraceae bacterium]